MNEEPDVKAKITFLTPEKGGRSKPAFSGYRPAHSVKDHYLTSGIHMYERESVNPGETVIGTIRFITPEAYPECLWEGKEIQIQEGSRLVGYATIIEIYNKTLLKK
ncbi:hypothetical protein [Cohnella sp. GbtcB17]|uniref:hypothetical protein n=1 Tax=Cohnella sp. GbtcB17 TaxID=2824762 RepID=UPI001C309CDF|nr:hypothetical protein [Cohnella sp. GbtcB17]